jgi:CheY-like chemotaxis protein/DNA-directed RNA polymerase subunit RPC12/RpoP
MNCPRCKTPVGPLADPDSIITCPGCGTRLMTRAAALRSQSVARAAAQSAAPTTPPPRTPPPPATPPPTTIPPSATLPPTPAMALGIGPPSQAKTAVARAATVAEPAGPEPSALQHTLESLLRELRAVRATQERILGLLLERDGAPSAAASDEEPAALSPIRAGARKCVVLIDDDERTRQAAVEELQRADVPVRAFGDGNAALSGIAEQKPDVIVLELGLGGDLAGKDVINMIKATMEWVDIPIVLWTREPVPNQKEARQIHGADEIVPKSVGAGALVARVITVFRRG